MKSSLSLLSFSSRLFTFFLLLSILPLNSCNEDAEFFNKEEESYLSAAETEEEDDASLGNDIIAHDDKENEDQDEEEISEDEPVPPKVKSAGTVTVLLALGDLAEDELVIESKYSQLLAENIIAYASPIENPKILVIKDYNHHGESSYDTEYIKNSLLKNYRTELLYETRKGVSPEQLKGYDVVWLNNPGHPMGSERTMQSLLSFSGGVVLSGDDLSRGNGFSTSELTGLQYIDNGARISCDNGTFYIDNNSGHSYVITLEPLVAEDLKKRAIKANSFKYGNDIDQTSLVNSDHYLNYEVLAYAQGEEETCDAKRPAIIRYQRALTK